MMPKVIVKDPGIEPLTIPAQRHRDATELNYVHVSAATSY